MGNFIFLEWSKITLFSEKSSNSKIFSVFPPVFCHYCQWMFTKSIHFICFHFQNGSILAPVEIGSPLSNVQLWSQTKVASQHWHFLPALSKFLILSVPQFTWLSNGSNTSSHITRAVRKIRWVHVAKVLEHIVSAM
jgi:hypothetical protein